jgi:hypothetical protein
VLPDLVHFGPQFLIIRDKVGLELVKTGRMVEVHGMAEFVDDKIAYKWWTEEQQILVQADGAATGTTPPTAFLAANLDFIAVKTDPGTYVLQPGNEVHPALMLQPAFQEILAALEITNITTDLQTGMVKVD